ncbi:hypothetical protein J6V85_02155, partial [Candidatus Saccharibacteria bacterium]|nr:hypothetical protein [Candidatus Saccharibacteria bacterium]
VGSACTLSAVENTAHTATIPSGTNQSDIGRTTFSMVCNDSGGFSIYAIGYGSNELGNTKLIASINGSAAPSYDINTGSNASGTPSSWAMKLTPGTNLTSSNILNGYGSYSVIPSSYTKVATLVPSTAVTNTSTLEATYRVNVASTQPAGNYNGKVRYVMVNPNTEIPLQPQTTNAGFIGYFPNAGSEVNDTMGDQTVNASDTSAQLWASNFKRPGYGFAGWSDAYDYVINVGSESNPNAHIYGPNETIEFTAGQYSSPNQGLSLYAVWVPSAGSIQNWSCPSNSSMPVGTVTALTDQRDNNTYAVAKLADSKCWMIENLRLDNTNSDNSTGDLAQGYGGQFIGLANPETANFDGNTPVVANSLYKSDGSGDTKGINGATQTDIGTINYPEYRIPRFRNDNTNTDTTANPNTTVANMTGIDQNIYGYGNYYSWHAAKANIATMGNPTTSDTALTSICPKGWHLPFGYTTGDFATLSNNLGGLNDNGVAQTMTGITTPSSMEMSKTFRAFPNNFVYSGGVNGSSVENRGSNGYYWSATALSVMGGMCFQFSYVIINPQTNNISASIGSSVRCVLEHEKL